MDGSQRQGAQTGPSNDSSRHNPELIDLVHEARTAARQQAREHGSALVESLNRKYVDIWEEWRGKLITVIREQHRIACVEAIAGIRSSLDSIDVQSQLNRDQIFLEHAQRPASLVRNHTSQVGNSVSLEATRNPASGGRASGHDFDENIRTRVESKRPEGASAGSHWLLNKRLVPAPRALSPLLEDPVSPVRRRSGIAYSPIDTGPPSKLPKLFHYGRAPSFPSANVAPLPMPGSSSSATANHIPGLSYPIAPDPAPYSSPTAVEGSMQAALPQNDGPRALLPGMRMGPPSSFDAASSAYGRRPLGDYAKYRPMAIPSSAAAAPASVPDSLLEVLDPQLLNIDTQDDQHEAANSNVEVDQAPSTGEIQPSTGEIQPSTGDIQPLSTNSSKRSRAEAFPEDEDSGALSSPEMRAIEERVHRWIEHAALQR